MTSDAEDALLLATVQGLERKAAELEDKARELLHNMQSLRTAVAMTMEELERLHPIAWK